MENPRQLKAEPRADWKPDSYSNWIQQVACAADSSEQHRQQENLIMNLMIGS
jgi:hypothetical protein